MVWSMIVGIGNIDVFIIRLKYLFGPNFRQFFSNKSLFWFCVQICPNFPHFCSIGSFFVNTL